MPNTTDPALYNERARTGRGRRVLNMSSNARRCVRGSDALAAPGSAQAGLPGLEGE